MVRHAEGAAPVNSLPRDEMSVACGADEADPSSEVVSSVEAVAEDSAVESEDEETASSDVAEADTKDELSSSGCE